MSSKKHLLSLGLTVALMGPLLTACGGAKQTSYDQYGQQRQSYQQPKKGMSTGKKVAMLAGAAALYYMYKKNQSQRSQGENVPQYYLSKNGKVYYRDAKGGVHWVEQPTAALSVPEGEARAYNVDQYRGYNGRTGGREIAGASGGSI